MRAVNADALIPKIKCIMVAENQIFRKGSWDFSGKCLAIVESEPTIEPERKTGRWTKAYDGNDGHVKCTGCFKTYDWISQAQYYNYCPNCGSKMELVLNIM